MNVPINAKRLRATLPDVVERVRKGTRFTVIYRSRAAFQIVPVGDAEQDPLRSTRTRSTAPKPRTFAGWTNRRGPRHGAVRAVKALFVDTAGWMACADAADPAHAQCRAARDGALEAGQALVTTDFVVDERLTLLRVSLGLRAAETWWHQVDGSSRLRWERIDGDRFEKARQLFFRYRDKTIVYRLHQFRDHARSSTDACADDGCHFRQAGFQVLPAIRGRD